MNAYSRGVQWQSNTKSRRITLPHSLDYRRRRTLEMHIEKSWFGCARRRRSGGLLICSKGPSGAGRLGASSFDSQPQPLPTSKTVQTQDLTAQSPHEDLPDGVNDTPGPASFPFHDGPIRQLGRASSSCAGEDGVPSIATRTTELTWTRVLNTY
jgi:hypothetical protein